MTNKSVCDYKKIKINKVYYYLYNLLCCMIRKIVKTYFIHIKIIDIMTICVIFLPLKRQ